MLKKIAQIRIVKKNVDEDIRMIICEEYGKDNQLWLWCFDLIKTPDRYYLHTEYNGNCASIIILLFYNKG